MRLWEIVRNIRPVDENEQLHMLDISTALADREKRTSENLPRESCVLSGEMTIRQAAEILDSLPLQSGSQDGPQKELQEELANRDQAGEERFGAAKDACTFLVHSADGSSVGEVHRKDLDFFRRHLEGSLPEEILEDLEIGVVAADAEGRIFFVNHAYEDLLGVPVHRTIGRNIFRIEPESDLCEALRNRRPVMNPRKYVQSADRYVSLKIHPLIEDGVFAGAVSLFTDVTELETLNTEIRRMSGMMEEFRQQLEENYQRTGVLTRDRVFLRLLDQAAVAAKTDVPILIRGENGVGKEVVARYIHRASARSDQPLVVVNCASIPETLIESELFGYEEGSFTGAKRGGKMGKFELANHGTIFLDEIGDMPVALQSRLLRVIQNGEIEKIGRQKTVPVDVRILAATNQPLEEMITRKTFREDLFYRLNVISLRIPPLRERREDIPLLAEHFVKEYTAKYGSSRMITGKGYRNLMGHAWSGNVRELQNCIERAVILSPEEKLDFAEYEEETAGPGKNAPSETELAGGGSMTAAVLTENPEKENLDESSGLEIGTEGFTLAKAMELREKELILQALKQTKGNREQAIRLLGLSRRTFYRKCAQHGITG